MKLLIAIILLLFTFGVANAEPQQAKGNAKTKVMKKAKVKQDLKGEQAKAQVKAAKQHKTLKKWRKDKAKKPTWKKLKKGNFKWKDQKK
jgi:hypothetical protein